MKKQIVAVLLSSCMLITSSFASSSLLSVFQSNLSKASTKTAIDASVNQPVTDFSGKWHTENCLGMKGNINIIIQNDSKEISISDEKTEKDKVSVNLIDGLIHTTTHDEDFAGIITLGITHLFGKWNKNGSITIMGVELSKEKDDSRLKTALSKVTFTLISKTQLKMVTHSVEYENLKLSPDSNIYDTCIYVKQDNS